MQDIVSQTEYHVRVRLGYRKEWEEDGKVKVMAVRKGRGGEGGECHKRLS